MNAKLTHGYDDWHRDTDERLRFSLTVAGVIGCVAVSLQLLVLGASALIRDALPFLIAGRMSSASRFVLQSGSSPLVVSAVIVIDIAVFWAMCRLATTRRGAGMMFVPVIFYLITCAVIGWLAVMPVSLAITQSR